MKAVATIVVEIDVDEPGLGVSVDSVRQGIEEYFYTANDMVGNMSMEMKEFVSGEVIEE